MTNRMHRRVALGAFALALTGLVAAAPSDGGQDPSQRIELTFTRDAVGYVSGIVMHQGGKDLVGRKVR